MSIRTLVEFNHDYAHEIADNPARLATLLCRYLRGGDREAGEQMERFGVRIVSQRHHADAFHIDEKTDGFPAKYFDRSERTGA